MILRTKEEWTSWRRPVLFWSAKYTGVCVFAVVCLLAMHNYGSSPFNTVIERYKERIPWISLKSISVESDRASVEQKKYVGLHLNTGRLGNQLFHLVSGYGIARTIDRIHYLPFENRRAHVEKYLTYLGNVFPLLNRTYVLAKKGTKQRNIKFARKFDSYANPSRLKNFTDQYLLLDFFYAQNVRYFENYVAELRAILHFSEEMKSNGSIITRSLQSHSDSMCLHVRTTDFINFHWATDVNKTVKAVNALAKKKNMSSFILFGDDQQVMINMSQVIIRDGGWKNDAVIVSDYQEAMDLYLSSQMCRSFLISATMSTFGWWLAFFAKDQSAVYYLNVTLPIAYKHRSDYFM
ncbi:unnamed protein product [Cylicocyclus nassatus]|uniref:L-Fucosyltransferase n=1 Tax=Cylicocyclus nassatus TaxID=53992 RepID=A0AA36MCV5_CYLNA|nr:unnamed protein product [Cylicocyclus nassatus]